MPRKEQYAESGYHHLADELNLIHEAISGRYLSPFGELQQRQKQDIPWVPTEQDHGGGKP